ncbi:serine hydrolase [Fibrella sp. WM1]|uniref:serine hydrolase n=1 Tax=Fibrella musci TaxID=3242485 RepID=UPI003522E19E
MNKLLDSIRPVVFLLLTPVLLLSSAAPVTAQLDSLAHQRMAQFIQKAINEGDASAIYELTAASFRQKMTPAQFAAGMNKFKVNTGQWIATTFRTQNERGIDYTADFEAGQQLFSLRLDAQGKIERINFALMAKAIDPKRELVPSDNTLRTERDTVVERLVRPYIQKGNTAGLVLAVIDQGRLYKYSYGQVDKRRNELPTSATLFEIGSVSKTFTALLLAQQVVAGNMALDDPINQYLPDSVPFIGVKNSPVRLVHLANHTSGFPRLPANIFMGKVDPKNPYQHYTIGSLYRFLMSYRASSQPGQTFSYSNYAAGLLGSLLEQRLKATYEQLIVTRISQPLGMAHTFVTIPTKLMQTFAQGYNEQGVATSPWDLASLQGSGAIRSTLDDMILYAKAQLGTKNGMERAINLSHLPTFNGPGQVMGLGWRIDQANQRTCYHHSGGTGGFRSFVGFDKTRQFAVVILSNAADDVTDIGKALLGLSTSRP